MRHHYFGVLLLCFCWSCVAPYAAADNVLQLAPFVADITPPVGQPVGLGFVSPAQTVEHPLLAKGVVLQDAGGVYVVCALDLMEIHNGSYDQLRIAIAQAAKTTVARVALQCLHQHTAPALDADAQRLQLAKDDPRRLATQKYTDDIARRIASAISSGMQEWQAAYKMGTSQARVERVASNRRLLQPDGTVVARMSSTTDRKLQQAPDGLIDPWLKTVSFLGREDRPLIQIHYYATHPQSFYGDGRISYDVPGIAREKLQRESGVFQIYFTGCGGDVAMGKYNNGTRAARGELAGRIYDAMIRSVAEIELQTTSPIHWRTEDIRFPLRAEAQFLGAHNRQILADSSARFRTKLKAAFNLAWVQRFNQRLGVQLSSLTIGRVSLVHLCGEPFVQYQLAAQKMRPEMFVAVAGYGDCGMSYIGPDRIYSDVGGYEQTYSFAGPSEQLLLNTIDRLLPDSE